MRKILEHGAFSRVIRCNRCGCKFSFESEDIKEINNNDTIREVVECPECNKQLVLRSTDSKVDTISI